MTMKSRWRRVLFALGLGIATFLAIGLADRFLPYSEAESHLVSAVSFPGALIAGLVYPEGIHTGNGAPLFVPFAMIANLAVYAAFWYFVCWLGWVLRRHRRGNALVLMTLLAAALLCSAGCDKGFSYYPDGWTEEEGGRWVKEWGDVRLRTFRVGGLIGSDSVIIDLEITNKTTAAIVMDEAYLTAKGKSYPRFLAREGERNAPWITIPPGMTRRFPAMWKLAGTEKRPITDFLGPDPKVALSFHEGSQSKTVEIHYVEER